MEPNNSIGKVFMRLNMKCAQDINISVNEVKIQPDMKK